MPLLAVCILVKVLTCGRSKLIIDWHNYGFTILRVNGVNNKIVTLARIYELTLGRFGDFHLTVSQAMKLDLVRIIPSLAARENKVHVLYDRATSKFKSNLSLEEKHELLQRIELSGFISL